MAGLRDQPAPAQYGRPVPRAVNTFRSRVTPQCRHCSAVPSPAVPFGPHKGLFGDFRLYRRPTRSKTMSSSGKTKGMVMIPTDPAALTPEELDAIAWRFLGSEFTGPTYAEWPIDRRVDAYLLHHGPRQLLADGSAYDALMGRVMANIGPALRNGVLPTPKI